MSEVEEDDYTDETSQERLAREASEIILDDVSQATVDKLVERMLLVVDEVSGHPLYGYQKPFAARLIESMIINDGATISALFSRQCLDGDTVVFRQDGSAVRLRNHEDVIPTGRKPTKRYKMRGGAEVIMTDNHPVLTPGGWLGAGLLRPGDLVSVATDVTQWVGMDTISRGILVGRHRVSKLVENKLDSEMARLLGYMVTDGSFRPGQSVKFTNTNELYLNEVADLVESKFGITAKRYPKGNGADLLFTTSKSSFDNSMLDFMHSIEWDHKFPLDIFRMTPEVVSEFVNRAWSGDGCISMKTSGPDIFLATGNDEIYARYWQALLLKFGVVSTVKREQMNKGTGTFYRLVVGSGALNVRRFFQSFGPIFGKEEQSWAAIDYFVNKAKRATGKGRSERTMFKHHGFGPDGEVLGWAKVIGIEDAGERDVFDMHVEGKSWFIAQGLQVSNSGKSETVANTVAAVMIMFPVLAKVFPELLGKYSDGVWVGAFAPVEDQADNLFGRIVARLTSDRAMEIMSDTEIDDAVEGASRTLKLKRSGSLVRKQTCHPRATIEGRTYHLILVDEAQGADEKVVNKCVVEGTSVWTPEGPSTIEDVVKNRRDILTYDGVLWNARPGELTTVIPATPSEWIENGTRDVWRVTTASGRVIESTEDHRWLVRERVGNRQMSIRMTKELSIGQTLPITLTAGYFGQRGSESDGYLVGQLLGDGCLRGSSVKWCGFRDAAYSRIEQIAADLGDSVNVWHVQPKSGLHEVGIVGGGALQFVRDEGLWGLKGDQKALQRSDYSKEFYTGFVAGLIDSDGSVISSRVSVATIGETLMRQFQESLLRLGINSRLSTRPNSGGFGVSPKPLWIVEIKARDDVLRLRELVTLYAQDKDERLDLLASKSLIKGSRRSSPDKRRGYPSGITFDRITSIEYAGIKNTYCVTVQPTHTVIWDGIVGLNSIGPMGASTNATMVFTGTPTYTKGVFYKQIQINKRRSTGRGSRRNHFDADWKEVARWNKNYSRFVNKELLRIGEDSDEFKLSYRLVWLLDRGMFATSERLDDLGDRSMEVVHAWHKSPVIIGIDPARKMDSTIVTVVWVDWANPDEFGNYDHRILNWLDLSGLEWEAQYFRIVEFISNYNVFAIAIDAGGVGDVVAGRLKVLLPHIHIEELGSQRPDQSKRWKHLSELMDRGKIGWPMHAKTRRLKTYRRFRQQMEDLEKNFEGPYVLAAAPRELDAHDDYCDSLALATSLTKDFTMPEVEQSSNVFY